MYVTRVCVCGKIYLEVLHCKRDWKGSVVVRNCCVCMEGKLLWLSMCMEGLSVVSMCAEG